MSNSSQNLLSYIRAIAGAWREDPRDDAQLLARFVETRDEQAFSTLVWRHGPLVWQSCKRVLGNSPDVDDAFQATFLTLSRQAAKLRASTLAGWLHRIARRAALKSVAEVKRRRNLQQQLQVMTTTETKKEGNRDELYAALDEDFASLPEKLRVPLLLRYLENKTLEEVARIVGCSRRVLGDRLTRGEAVLRTKLERRGLALGGVSIAGLLGDVKIAPVPARLIESTSKAAVAFQFGTFTGVSAETAEKLLHSLSAKGIMWKSWCLIAISVSFLGLGGVGLIVWKMFGDGSSAVNITEHSPALPKVVVEQNPKLLDFYGDPLPEGAIARIGTIRLRVSGNGPSLGRREAQNKTALSPDEKTLILAWNHNLHFFDTSTGKELRKFSLKDKVAVGQEVATECKQISFSPDGKLLVIITGRSVGDSGDTIQLIDATTGHQSGDDLVSGRYPVIAATFSSDGKILAFSTAYNSVALYDIDRKEQYRTMQAKSMKPSSFFNQAIFSHDSRILACVEAATGTVHLFDTNTGKETDSLRGQQVKSLLYTPDNQLVTVSQDRIVRVWDVKNRKETRELGEMRYWLQQNSVSPIIGLMTDGKTVMAAGPGQIRFWDVESGKETRLPLTCNNLFRPTVFSVDGTKLIERVGNAVSIWDVKTGKETGPTAGASRSLMNTLVFSPNGKALLAITEPEIFIDEGFTCNLWQGRAAFQIWDILSGKSLGSLLVPANPVRGFGQMTWLSDDTVLAEGMCGTSNPAVATTFRWKEVSSNKIAAKADVYGRGELSPDGQVFVRRNDERLELFEVVTGKKLANVPCCQLNNEIAFSPDHRLLAIKVIEDQSIDEKGSIIDLSSSVEIWDVSTGHFLYSFNLPANASQADDDKTVDSMIGFSADGRLIVTQNSKTKTISLWEHISGKRRLQITMPAKCRCANVVFSLDSLLMAAGCAIETGSGPFDEYEKTIRIWDLSTGQEIQHFQGHQAGDWGAPFVAFSSDSRHLASAGGDYTVSIWDVKHPHHFQGPSEPLSQEELQKLKTALSGDDAVVCYQAIQKLCQIPEQAVPLMAECLTPDTLPLDFTQSIQELPQLIRNLDSDDFQTRRKAFEKINNKLNVESEKTTVEKTLRDALKSKISVETVRAIKLLLASVKEKGGVGSSELVRMVRAIEVLERIGNKPARELLACLVESPPRPEIRREAEAVLKRLKTFQAVSKD